MVELISLLLFVASMFFAGYQTGKLDQRLSQELEMAKIRVRILNALSKDANAPE